MGGEQAEEQPGGVPPAAHAVLWGVGLDHHHAHINAAGGMLPLPVHRLSLRNMETRLQDAKWRSLDRSQRTLNVKVLGSITNRFDDIIKIKVFIKR